MNGPAQLAVTTDEYEYSILIYVSFFFSSPIYQINSHHVAIPLEYFTPSSEFCPNYELNTSFLLLLFRCYESPDGQIYWRETTECRHDMEIHICVCVLCTMYTSYYCSSNGPHLYNICIIQSIKWFAFVQHLTVDDHTATLKCKSFHLFIFCSVLD